MAKALSDYGRVRESYFAPNGELFRVGELVHRKHPYYNADLCDPVATIAHDIESATAAPGEKRAAKITDAESEDE